MRYDERLGSNTKQKASTTLHYTSWFIISAPMKSRLPVPDALVGITTALLPPLLDGPGEGEAKEVVMERPHTQGANNDAQRTNIQHSVQSIIAKSRLQRKARPS